MKFINLRLRNWLIAAALASPRSAGVHATAWLRGITDGDAAPDAQRRRDLAAQCEGSDPSSCGCDSVLQADYRGTISAAGTYTCQAWTAQSPHRHNRTPSKYPDKGLGDHNHCRNPDGESGGAWCYTTDPGKRWEYCDVPSCVPQTDPTVKPTSPPTNEPTTSSPTNEPTTKEPTTKPTDVPTDQPTKTSTNVPTNQPTKSPTGSLPVCSTPELTSLEALTSDRRTAFQNAALPTITGGTSSAASQASCTTELSKKKVLMVGIDGLRADVVGMTPLPTIRRLQAMGTYSFWADVQSTASAVSGPGWTSMFTGVQPSKHLVDGNSDLTDVAYPTVFKMAKDAFGLKIAASVSWSPLVTQIIDHEDASTLDDRFLASSDTAMAQKAVEWIASEQFDFVFVDFDGPDAAGHSSGFDGYASAYQTRVRETDALVGTLLDAVLATSSGEEWLIVVTSDHGGEGTGHGPNDPYNRKIPFLVASNSPRVDVGFMPFEDPGSHMDVLPTVMHFLGGPTAVPDGLDGQVFGFRDHVRAGPPVCASDPDSCGCDDVLQADYRGDLSVTETGLTCQAWDAQSPQTHDRTAENYPDKGLGGHNHCRNPDGEPRAWCYTTDPNTRWALCQVPSCDTTT